MEFLLRWWDELDDSIATSRYIVAVTFDELGSSVGLLATACLSLLLTPIRFD
ncbi:MAG: hypothetical protein WCE48_09965 [Steroidobacteraceae bacterium]